MKKALCLALCAGLLALAACAAQPAADPPQSSSAPAAPAAEDEPARLRELLARCGVDIETTRFETRCTVERFMECTVYSSVELPDVAALLVERPDGSAFYLTLPDNSTVDGMCVDDAGLLNVLTDGVITGEGEVMRGGMGVFRVDVAAGEAVSYRSNEFVHPEGVYGRECTAVDDRYTFGEWAVTEDAVTFTFVPAGENAGWTGTELCFLPVWNSDADGEGRMAVLFHNTAAPDPALAAQMETLPGVLEATFTEVDNEYVTGTLLEVRTDARCVLSHNFNGGVPGPALESYTIRCYMPDPNDGAPVGGPFIPNPDYAADIAEKERKAMEELGMLDPTPAPAASAASG